MDDCDRGATHRGGAISRCDYFFFVLFYCYQLCMFNSRLVSDHAHRVIVNCPKGMTAEGR